MSCILTRRGRRAAAAMLLLIGSVLLPLSLASYQLPAGKLSVQLHPDSDVSWAQIEIDGRGSGRVYRDRGRVVTVKMRMGRAARSVKVRVHRGSLTVTKSLNVRSRRTTRYRPVLKRRVQYGFLRLRLNRNSRRASVDVFLNNKERGRLVRGKVRRFRVQAGAVQIRLEASGKTYRKTVAIRKGQTRLHAVTFPVPDRRARIRVRLAADADVNRARLSIDGEFKGNIYKNRAVSFTVPRGNRRLSVKAGRLEWKTSRRLRGGQRITIRVPLKMRYGTLKLNLRRNSRAPWVRLTVNGRNKGRLKRGQSRIFRIKPGRATVVLRWRNRSKTFRYRVKQGKQTYRTIRFPRDRRGTLILTHSSRSRFRRGRLYINGTFVDNLNRGNKQTLKKQPGKYTIELRYKRQRVRRVVTLTRGATKDVVLRFRRKTRRYGFLRVQYTDDSRYDSVKLYVGSRYYGVLYQGDERRIRLRAGSHTVKVKAGTRTQTRTARVQRRKTTTLEFRFRQRNPMGRLQVYHSRSSLSRRARLYINGKNRGWIRKGQKKAFRLKAGRYTVLLRDRKNRAIRRVQLRPGRTHHLSLRIGTKAVDQEKGTVILSLKGSFRWAKVYVNGKYKGRVNRGRALKLALPAGKRYKIKVSRDDMDSSAQRSIYLREGETERVPISLIYTE